MRKPIDWRFAATVSAVAGLLVAGLLVSSCGTDSEPSATSRGPTDVFERDHSDPGWVGKVDGTNAFAAVVAGGGQVVAYACDGDAGIAEWFTGETDNQSSFTLNSHSGAAMTGNVAGAAVTGTLDFGDGVSHRFTLDRAEAGAGLYRVEDPDAARAAVSAGWVVDNDGDQRGSLRIGTVTRAAPALPGWGLVINGSRYAVVGYSVPDPALSKPGAPAPIPIPYPVNGS